MTTDREIHDSFCGVVPDGGRLEVSAVHSKRGGQCQTIRRRPALKVAERHPPATASFAAGAGRFLQPHAAQSASDTPMGDKVRVAVFHLCDGLDEGQNLLGGEDKV